MKRHESVRGCVGQCRIAGLVAGVLAAAMAIGCSEAGTGDDESIVEQSSALTAPAGNDWAQFQHDAVHSGDNAAEAAFTSAKLHKPLQIAFKAHYGSSGDESGAVEAGGILYVADSGSDPDFAGKVSAFNAAGCGGAVGGIVRAAVARPHRRRHHHHARGQQRLRHRRVPRGDRRRLAVPVRVRRGWLREGDLPAGLARRAR